MFLILTKRPYFLYNARQSENRY